MPIVVQCGCGQALRTPDESAGKRIRCPRCQTILSLPAAVLPPLARQPEMLEVVEDDAPHSPVFAPPVRGYDVAEPSYLPRTRDLVDDEELRRRLSRPRRRPRRRDDDGPDGPGIASVCLGGIGLIAWCVPILGVVVTGTGLSMGIKSLNSSNAKVLGIIGTILNAIGLVLSIGNWILGVLLIASGKNIFR